MRKFFYNLSILSALAAISAFLPSALSAEITVPAVGSTWVSVLEYKALPGTNDEGGSVAGKHAQETMTVVHHSDGVPVFASEVFGYKGKFQESSSGTIVYTDKCEEFVPKEVFVPPATPNQCGWHICSTPAEGVTFTRQMTVFAELYSCVPIIGTYSYTTVGKDEVNGESVVVGDAEVSFGLFQKTKWKSYVSNGRGEVYATSSSRETLYSRVEVSQVPYVGKNTLPAAPITFVKAKEKSQCDVVAFGDSLTQGMGVSQSESYPSVLSKLVGKEVCNLGISGNTTKDAKDRLSQILALKPKAVFMAIGANDLLKGISPSDTKSNIEVMVNTFIKADIMVAVLGFEGLKTSMTKEMLASLASVKSAVSGNENIVYIPKAFAGVLNEKGMLSDDNMHPNAAGYKKIAENVYDEVFGILQVLSGFVIKK